MLISFFLMCFGMMNFSNEVDSEIMTCKSFAHGRFVRIKISLGESTRRRRDSIFSYYGGQLSGISFVY